MEMQQLWTHHISGNILRYSVDTVVVDYREMTYLWFLWTWLLWILVRTKGKAMVFLKRTRWTHGSGFEGIEIDRQKRNLKEDRMALAPIFQIFGMGPTDELAIQSYVSLANSNTAGRKNRKPKSWSRSGTRFRLANDYQKLYQRAVFMIFKTNKIYNATL